MQNGTCVAVRHSHIYSYPLLPRQKHKRQLRRSNNTSGTTQWHKRHHRTRSNYCIFWWIQGGRWVAVSKGKWFTSHGNNTRGNYAGATTPVARHSGTTGITRQDQINVCFGGWSKVGRRLLAKVRGRLLFVMVFLHLFLFTSHGRNTRGNCARATTPAAQHSSMRSAIGRDQINVFFGGYRKVGGWLLAKVGDSLSMAKHKRQLRQNNNVGGTTQRHERHNKTRSNISLSYAGR